MSDKTEMLKYLVAPAGEGWKWAATWTRTERDGERHAIEFYRTIPPAKTPEERVRIEQRKASDGSWEVWEDENYCGNHSERNAKALRIGLIATLKQEG